MPRSRFFALLVALWIASPAAGDGVLTLERAMAEARSRVAEVEAAQARVEAGQARLRQARSYRKPQLRLQEIWTRTDSPAEAFGLLLNQERFSLAEFSAGDPNDPVAIENALTRIEVELPVYTGGELGGRIRQAELAGAAAGQSASWIEGRAALAGAEAHIQLGLAREHVALLERSLATVEAHVELARAYVEQGLLVRSEQLRAEVERARISGLLAEARGRERLAVANLGFRLGMDSAGGWNLAPLGEAILPEEPLEAWLESAETRSDLEAARRGLEAFRLEESILRSGRKPKVGLLARHDRFDESLFGASGESSAILAMASIDLFSGGRHREAAASARLDARAVELEVERFREGIQLEVRDVFERLLSAHEQQATARAALTAAREAERIVGERFESGVAKTLDVLDALTARREAELRELASRAESHMALLRLAVTAGRRPESVLAGRGKLSMPAGADEKNSN